VIRLLPGLGVLSILQATGITVFQLWIARLIVLIVGWAQGPHRGSSISHKQSSPL
jgi:hypothetical protein